MLLSDRVWRRRDVISRLSEWIQDEAESSDAGWARVKSRDDGWLVLEAENQALMDSILKLYAYFPLPASTKPPYTVKITRITGKSIEYAYPFMEGERKAVASLKAWTASLGGMDDVSFLQAAGIVEGAAAGVSLNLPSMKQAELVWEALRIGLDRILLIDVAPQEAAELLADRRTRGFIASHRALTLLTHILYLKLGSRTERALDRVMERLEPLGAKAIPMPWRTLRECMGRVGVEPTTSAV